MAYNTYTDAELLSQRETVLMLSVTNILPDEIQLSVFVTLNSGAGQSFLTLLTLYVGYERHVSYL